MAHLRDGTETEMQQLNKTIRQQEGMLAQKANELADLSAERDALQDELKIKSESVERLTRSLDAIYQSHGWKVLLTRYGLRDRVA
jgi:predicted  nucleic acid-binding Zn-ribbon protein